MATADKRGIQRLVEQHKKAHTLTNERIERLHKFNERMKQESEKLRKEKG